MAPLSYATAAGLLAALSLTACGGSSSSKPNPNAPEKNPPGDIPDNQAFVRFAVPGRGFSVKVPEGWSQRRSGGAVVFTDKLNTIRLESRPASQPPSVAAARRPEGPVIRRTVKGFRAPGVRQVARTRGPAV